MSQFVSQHGRQRSPAGPRSEHRQHDPVAFREGQTAAPVWGAGCQRVERRLVRRQEDDDLTRVEDIRREPGKWRRGRYPVGERLSRGPLARPISKDEGTCTDLTLGRCLAGVRRLYDSEDEECEAERQSSNGWAPDSVARAASPQRLAQKSPCGAAAPSFQAETASAFRPAR